VRVPVQIRYTEGEFALLDTRAEELSRQSYGTHFSRAEIMKLATCDLMKARQPPRPEPKAFTGKKGQR